MRLALIIKGCGSRGASTHDPSVSWEVHRGHGWERYEAPLPQAPLHVRTGLKTLLWTAGAS